MSKPFRLAVLNTHPIQYFAPLYAHLSTSAELEVTALYCTDFSLRGGIDPGFKLPITWDVALLSGYRYVFLGKKSSQLTPNGFWSLICPTVWSEVRSGRYDGVWLHGYNYAAFVIAFIAAKSCGLPVFMRCETHLGLQRSKWKRWLRDIFLVFVYRYLDGFLAIGSANRDYYRSLGVPDKKIFDVPYTVDNERFIAASNITPVERAEIRSRYHLPSSDPVVLYASKFMARKHPSDVIRAMAILSKRGIHATVFMVGTGEMESELRALVKDLDLNNVIFGGFVNQTELPRVFAASDIFVLPAENEPWGLIVNEVMCAGMPVVVSREVGCVPDLVHDGVNGFHMRAGDADSLALALSKLICDQALAKQMGRSSLEIIMGWSYERCKRGVVTATQYVRSIT